MVRNISITTLVDNTVRQPALLAEHGLSFWMEADGHRILFDTGQGKVLLGNCRRLGVKLDTAEAVVLSHGHRDHTGGLLPALNGGGRPDVYLHPAALGMKFSQQDGAPARSIGIPDGDEPSIRAWARNVVYTRGPTEVIPGIYVTGEIPRRTDFEDTGGRFYLDEACTQPDPLADDQALFLESTEGVIVLLGCAHAGVVNTLEYVAQLAGTDQVRAVLGGMHLLRASRERIEKTAQALGRFPLRVIAAGHCTGLEAIVRLSTELPNRVMECAAGSRFTFPL